jgi:tetratricopeptide (TPR) repeat protein
MNQIEISTDLVVGEPGVHCSEDAEKLLHLGKLCAHQGKLDEALEAYEDVVKLRNGGSLNIANVHCLIAEILVKQGNFVKATKNLKIGLDLKRTTLGGEHLDVAKHYVLMADALAAQERYDEAILMHNKCINIRTNLLGPQSKDTKQALENKAKVEKTKAGGCQCRIS